MSIEYGIRMEDTCLWAVTGKIFQVTRRWIPWENTCNARLGRWQKCSPKMWSQRWENMVVPSMKARVLEDVEETGWSERGTEELRLGVNIGKVTGDWGLWGKLGVFRTEATPRLLRRYWVLEKESDILKSLLRTHLLKHRLLYLTKNLIQKVS